MKTPLGVTSIKQYTSYKQEQGRERKILCPLFLTNLTESGILNVIFEHI